MVGYWFYKFNVEDRDIGVVDYELLVEIPDTAVPVPILCFSNPFLPQKLSQISKYIEYMKGDFFDNEMANIAYENVTFNLHEYLMYGEIKWRNGSVITYGPIYLRATESFNGWNKQN